MQARHCSAPSQTFLVTTTDTSICCVVRLADVGTTPCQLRLDKVARVPRCEWRCRSALLRGRMHSEQIDCKKAKPASHITCRLPWSNAALHASISVAVVALITHCSLPSNKSSLILLIMLQPLAIISCWQRLALGEVFETSALPQRSALQFQVQASATACEGRRWAGVVCAAHPELPLQACCPVSINSMQAVCSVRI